MKKLDLIKALSAVFIIAAGVSAKDVWVGSNSKTYSITNGVVDSVQSEIDYTYISYTDDKHFEVKYEQKTGNSITNSTTLSRNGNTTVQQAQVNTSYTATTTLSSDEESGLMLSSTSIVSIGTNITEVETNYTIELLNTEGDIKTYKHYETKTGGTGTYTVYKVQNGITLEMKIYTNGVLSTTATYTFPDNAIIRAKIPSFTLLSSFISETTPTNNYYRTYELVSDSENELVIIEKRYNTDGVLTGQIEGTYIRFAGNTPIAKTAANKAAASISFAGIINGQINLNLKAGTYTAQLYNLQGRRIKSVDITATNGINATNLRIDNLSKGIFVLNVKQAGVSVLKHKIAVKR